MRKLIVLMVMMITMLGQSLPAQSQASTTSRKPAGVGKSDVDVVIDLVKGGMSESLVIKQLQRQGKIHKLENSDLLKLAKAGVTENIINVFMDPKASLADTSNPPAVASTPPATNNLAAVAAPIPQPAPAPAANAVVVTPFPPDLEGVPSIRKRRLVVAPINYAAAKEQIQYWFNRQEDVGEGIRSMLAAQMNKSASIVLLERRNLDALLKELDFSASNRVSQGQKPRIGEVSGADSILVGEVVAFGVGSTSKQHNLDGLDYLNIWRPTHIPHIGAGQFKGLSKEDKALVIVNFRIVDAETLEVLASDSARGESSHKGREIKASLWGPGTAGNFSSGSMTSPDFQKTIIGEATSDAVNKIANLLESKIPALRAKTRKVEGRVASITTSGIYLALGENDGVLLGDRFEILQINNPVVDPTTKNEIDFEGVKVGELVVNNIREKTAIGNYGGQPLSAAQLAGKGYAARLMTK